MADAERIQVNVDLSEIRTRSDYRKVWAGIPAVEAINISDNESCQHAEGVRFFYRNHYDKPDGICTALHHVFQLYVWRAALGFPSWEPDDPSVFRIHCPAKKGTVWELRRVEGPASEAGSPSEDSQPDAPAAGP